MTATGAASEIGRSANRFRHRERAAADRSTKHGAWSACLRSVGRGQRLRRVLYGWLRSALARCASRRNRARMSLLPEEFPVILTVFMVMGAWRISRAGVLTRRSAAIETLGAATVLCTDKTGTLTENRMTIADVRPPTACWGNAGGRRRTPIGSLRSRLWQARSSRSIRWSRPSICGRSNSRWTPPRPQDLVRQYPLGSGLLAMTNVWRRAGRLAAVAAKGAPEAIADLCRLSPARSRRIAESAEQWRSGHARARRREGGSWTAIRRLPARLRVRFFWVWSGLPIRCGRRARGRARMPLGRHPRRS